MFQRQWIREHDETVATRMMRAFRSAARDAAVFRASVVSRRSEQGAQRISRGSPPACQSFRVELLDWEAGRQLLC